MINESEIHESYSQGIRDSVHCEMLCILYRQTKHMIWAEVFAASLILFILWWPNTVDRPLLLTWYGLMLAITLPRYILANAYERTQPARKQCYLWEKIIMLMLFVSALGWSFAGTILLPEKNVLNQGLILLLLVGVAATANPFYSPIKKIYAIFITPTLLLTSVYLMLRGSNLDIFLGIAMFLFSILMLTTAIVSSNLISAALTFRFQNMKLAEDLLKTNEALELMATHDVLTSLPNRQMFNTMLITALENARLTNSTFYLMFLDIDKFKKINDSLGHDIGDQLLVTVAKRLHENFRGAGKVSRLGGDEFIIILGNVADKVAITRLAENCCLSIAEAIHIKNHTLYVSTSIGISFYPQDGKDAESLISHADKAMYVSKQKGGNNFHFYNDTVNHGNFN